MKKIRITIKKNSLGRKFQVFNSPEALYIWLHDPELQAMEKLDSSLGSTIILRPSETMEVEWIGCEFYNEDNTVLRMDQIRLAKTMKTKVLDTNKIIGIHNGWIIEKIMSFKSNEDDDVKVSKLTNKSKHKFNIEELFKFSGLLEKDEIDHKDIN